MRIRLITAAVVAILVCVLPNAEAQSNKSTPKLGYLSNSGGQSVPDAAFFRALRDLGYIDRSNVIIEARYSGGHSERFPEFAADLVRRGVQVIAAWSPTAVAAAKRETNTVPIVGISMGSDPVALGWAASLARPNGNVTGFSSGDVWLVAKRMELLKETIPAIVRVAVLANPTNPAFREQTKEAETSAQALRVQVNAFPVDSPGALTAAFSNMKDRRVGAVLVMPDGMLWAQRAEIVRLAAEHRLPAMYWTSDYIEAGGLMSYAESLNDLAFRAAGYVDRILKGAKPADLPIEQPTKFELIVSQKTAKLLGLTVPPAVLLRADQVIE